VVGYALAGALLTGLVVLGLGLVLEAESARAVAWMGLIAWALQVPLFAGLVALRSRPGAFFAAWGGGTLARLAAVAVAAVVVARATTVPPAPALLGLAGFFFVLLLLEPVFFRMGMGNR
jgi:hypothetical protein